MKKKLNKRGIFQKSIETLIAEHIIVLDDELSVTLSISKSKNLANSASPICSLI
jgi:hypothetical protein